MFRKVFIISVLLFSSNFLFAQNSGISVQAGGYFPIGNFADVYETGLGGNLGIHFALSRHLQLGILGGYTRHNFNTSGLNKTLSELNNTDINLKIDAPIDIIPVMLSLRYIFESSRLKPYLVGELGVHYVSMDSPTFTFGTETFDPDITASDIALGFGAGVGFLFKLDRGLYIDITGKFNGNTLTIAEIEESDSGPKFVERNITWLSVNAGLFISF